MKKQKISRKRKIAIDASIILLIVLGVGGGLCIMCGITALANKLEVRTVSVRTFSFAFVRGESETVNFGKNAHT